MLFNLIKAMIDGCVAVMVMPINLGGFVVSLWIILFGAAVIGITARLIWGLLQ